MNQEHFAAVGHEEDIDGMATFDDFAVEELEDRLELDICVYCPEGKNYCLIYEC